MSVQVTKLSQYDDVTWDFWKEYHSKSYPSQTRIHFTGVWQRNPEMCATIKAFLWQTKQGTATEKPETWTSVLIYADRIRSFANAMEMERHTSFATVDETNLLAILQHLPNSSSGQETLRVVGDLFISHSLPHVPVSHPFGHNSVRDLLDSDFYEQTEPIPELLLDAMIRRCVEYESRAPALLRLHNKTAPNWESSLAVERGLKNRNDLKRELRLTQTAGLIMMLAATGMRASELTAIKRDGLSFAQSSKRWYIWSTVYKFHEGREVRWQCGELGRRAFHLLKSLTTHHHLSALPTKGTRLSSTQLTIHIREWMEAQEWRDLDGKPHHIHAHQFRRTFALVIFATNLVSELAIKDQFKHKSLAMTDHYLTGGGIRDMIIKNHPAAHSVAYEETMRVKTGLEN